MTMTPTEAKALAHSLHSRAKYYRSRSDMDAIMDAGMMGQAADYIEATEARHAAEMRELKGRFSEVAESALSNITHWQGSDVQAFRDALAPFIIAKPDPLVEIAREMTLLDGVFRTDNQKAAIREGRAGSTTSEDFCHRLRVALQDRGYQVSKIGEAGE